MKGAILLCLSPFFALAQQGSLEGVAIHAITREPLPNVHVRLLAVNLNGLVGAYGAMSDRAGHFSIATIRPGTYILIPERPGFLHVQAKGSTAIPNIAIKPGEAVTGYQLEMTPRAVISGRVVDEAGDPVQGVRVQAVPVPPGSTPLVLTQTPYQSTDDRGEFRLAGPAGKFYVQAIDGLPSGGNGPPEKRTDGTTQAVYASTFFPSSLKKERAAVVETVAGKEVGGIEIRLARQQPGLNISGIVHGISDGNWRGTVILQTGENSKRVNSSLTTSPAPDGKFRFENVPAGFYRVWATYNDGGKADMASRIVEGQVEQSEIANVELDLTGGIDVSGNLKVEGAPAGAAKRTVKLESLTGFGRVNQAMKGGDVDDNGAFRFSNVLPGRYRVKVEPAGENAYLKSLALDGAAVTGDVADLSSALRGASLKMTLDLNGAQLSGHVLDAGGNRMQTNIVMMFLAKTTQDLDQIGDGAARVEPDGSYSIKAIAPGKYRLFAVDLFQVAGALENSQDAFLKGLFERGEEIEIKAGDRIVKDFRVLAPEDPNAKPAK